MDHWTNRVDFEGAVVVQFVLTSKDSNAVVESLFSVVQYSFIITGKNVFNQNESSRLVFVVLYSIRFSLFSFR